MKSNGQRTNNDPAKNFRLPNRVCRRPCRLDNHPPIPPTSRGLGSSGNTIRFCRSRKCMADDGRRAANRRGALIEVDAENPTLECEPADDRRRFDESTRENLWFSRRVRSIRRRVPGESSALLASRLAPWRRSRGRRIDEITRARTLSGERCRRRTQGDPREVSAAKLSEWTTASNGSLVQRALGRGSPGGAQRTYRGRDSIIRLSRRPREWRELHGSNRLPR